MERKGRKRHLPGMTITLRTSLSGATTEAKKLRITIFKVLREGNCQSRILNPVKPSFQNESEMKIFSD